MRVTQWGEFGIHCAVCIADAERRGQIPIGGAEIARSQSISTDYVQQVLHRLKRGGIIESVRGPQGGYKLNRPAAEITLGDILSASEGDTFEVICETHPLNPERCNSGVNCALRDIWHELREHVNTFLESRSLEQLLNQTLQSGPPHQSNLTPTESRPVQIGGRSK